MAARARRSRHVPKRYDDYEQDEDILSHAIDDYEKGKRSTAAAAAKKARTEDRHHDQEHAELPDDDMPPTKPEHAVKQDTHKPSRKTADGAGAHVSGGRRKKEEVEEGEDGEGEEEGEDGGVEEAQDEDDEYEGEEDDEDAAEEEDDDDYDEPVRKKPGAKSKRGGNGGASRAKAQPKSKKGKTPPGEAHGQMKTHRLDDLPLVLLEYILDLVVDGHELRSYWTVCKDMLSIRATCKTLRDLAYAFMPAIERRLCKEAAAPSSTTGSLSLYLARAPRSHAHHMPPVTIRNHVFKSYTGELDTILRTTPLTLTECMSVSDAITPHIQFHGGYDHERQQKDAVKLQRMIVNQLPPRFFGLSSRARHAMRVISHDRMPVTQAKSAWSLRPKDLDGLSYEVRENPRDPTYAPMKLYMVAELKQRCLARHRSVDGWHCFKDKSAKTATKARNTREANQGTREADIIEELESFDLNMTSQQMASYFREYIQHKAGTPGPLALRAREVVQALEAHNAKLPQESYLARAYIDKDADGKRRAARAARKTAAQDSRKKKASAGAPTATQVAPSPGSRPLQQMLPTIMEADFFINRTTFASVHHCKGTAQRYHSSYWDDDYDYVDDTFFGDMEFRDDLWDEAKRESDEFVASMEDALVQYMQQWNLRTHAHLAAHDAMPDCVKVQAARLLTRV